MISLEHVNIVRSKYELFGRFTSLKKKKTKWNLNITLVSLLIDCGDLFSC